jgi:hypothetical protein
MMHAPKHSIALPLRMRPLQGQPTFRLFITRFMSTSTPTPIVVSKESIASSVFPAEEVLTSAEAKKNRQIDLEKATTLGNVEHNKIKIIFQDEEAVKQVETTIWATTDKRIILKGGVVIPINRIHQVRIL